MPLVEERVECSVCHKEHTSWANHLQFIHKQCLKDQRQNRETKQEIINQVRKEVIDEINIMERKVYVLALTSKFKDHRIFSEDIYPLIFDLKKYSEVKK